MHRKRDGFLQKEQFDFAQRWAFELSDSSSASSSLTAGDYSNIKGQHARRPSRFLQSTFRDSGGTKDDMAMPSRKNVEILEAEFPNKAVESEANNSRDRRKPKNKQFPKRLISQDDSMVGTFLTSTLRPHPGDKKTTKRCVLDSSLTSSLTSRHDIKNSLVAKLGSNAIANTVNKAVGRRRASVNVLTGSGASTVPPAEGDRSSARSRTPVRKGRSASLGLKNRKEEPKESTAGLKVESKSDDRGGEGEHSIRRHRHHGHKEADSHSRIQHRMDDNSNSKQQSGLDDGNRRQGRQADSNDRRSHRLEHSRRALGTSDPNNTSRSPASTNDRHRDRDSRSPGSHQPRNPRRRGDSRSHSPQETGRRRTDRHSPTQDGEHRRRNSGDRRARHGNHHSDPAVGNHDSHEKRGHSPHPKDSRSPEADRHHRRHKPRERTGKEGGESEPSKETGIRTADLKSDTVEASPSPKIVHRRARGSLVMIAPPSSQPVSQEAASQDHKGRHRDEPNHNNDRHGHQPSREPQKGEGSRRKVLRKRSKSTGNLTADSHGDKRRPKLGRTASSSDQQLKTHNREGTDARDVNHHSRRNLGEGSRRKVLRKRSKSTGNLTADSHVDKSKSTGNLTGDKRRPKLGRRARSSDQLKTHSGERTDAQDGNHHSRRNLSPDKSGRALRYEAAAAARSQGEKVTLPPPSLLQQVYNVDRPARRRQTVSPRGRVLTNQNNGEQSKSSRFKEALRKMQESGDDSSKLAPAGRPGLRRASSLSKLETRSRMSIKVKDLSTQSEGGGRHTIRLDRSRMMFLDESISFSDSDLESDGDDGGDNPTKDGKTSVLPEEFDADFSSDPSFSMLNVDSTSAREIPPFGARSSPAIPRLTMDLDHVDLTALSAPQVQLLLARARNNAT